MYKHIYFTVVVNITPNVKLPTGTGMEIMTLFEIYRKLLLTLKYANITKNIENNEKRLMNKMKTISVQCGI